MGGIYGIGTDLVATQRIERAIASHPDRFARRILADTELVEFLAASHPARFLSKRFAAKEAFSKAFGTGIGEAVGWHDVWVQHASSGAPVLSVSDALAARMAAVGAGAMHVSLSDETEHALAFVVIERTS